MSHPFGGLYGDDSPQAETGSEGHLAGDFLAHGGDLAGHAWSDDLAGHLPGDGHLPDGLHDVAGDQQWDPGTDPGTAPGTDPGHPLVYPPAVPQEYQGQDSADPILSIYDSVDSGMASEASQIWGYAHPGEAWPYDGSVPESPAQLMEQVAGDPSVAASVQQTAANWLASDTAQMMVTTAPPDDTVRITTDPVPVTVPVTEPVTEPAPASDPAPAPQPATTAPQTVTTSPDAATPTVQHDLQYWFYQHTDYTCAPASATELINEFTGTHFANEDAVADYAQQQGWLSGTGMTFDDLPALLDHFGVPAHEESAGTGPEQALTTLEHAVDDQHKGVVMFVNAADYWYKDEGASEGGAAPHAVRIVDIDEKNGLAVLSDTGNPGGKGITVPLSQLMLAWGQEQDGGTDYPLVVTDGTDPAYVDAPSQSPDLPPAPSVSPAPAFDLRNLSAAPSQPGPGHGEAREILEWVVLPVAVGVGLVARSLRR
jgi:hypothetical protein